MVGVLTKLRKLELRENCLNTLPKSFAQLSSLEFLDLGGNEFASVGEMLVVLVTAAIMTDIAGLDNVPCGASPRVTICGRRPGQFKPFSSPAPETEYGRSKNHLHVLTD
ncbi:unnamed protein product [Dibothriocephalus latus]|uniref:Uncharacterized protein n=1 Tax=Dibothriocephalus latus TaxID=60516 RepID=A0A3P7R1Z4_DIBLA|nr:unnamed protein product [Dibothriocephalus latus]